MKKYSVVVNGTAYEVEIEEISASEARSAAPVQEKPAQPPVSAPQGGETIKSPMPGNILDVRVAPGDAVKSGQVLMILEAMKMENEIMCPRDARVVSVAVKKGDTVEPDSVLCVIE